MAKNSEWCGVYVGSDRSKAAVKSWFSPYCDDVEILSARVLSDIRTDATKKVEIIISDKHGGKRRVTRTFGARRYSISFKPHNEPRAAR
jgi:hypothetical protein